MDKQALVLLYGGRSGEHEVSLRSAAYVLENVDQRKYKVYLIGITKDGVWYLQDANHSATDGVIGITIDEKQIVSIIPGKGLHGPGGLPAKPIVFPVLHGSFGEDGTLQGALEMANLPYVGGDVLGCALSMDKAMIKKVWQDHKLPVIPFKALLKSVFCSDVFSLDSFYNNELKKFGMPLIVKPANTGSSLGVSKVDDISTLQAALEDAFLYDRKLLVEPCVDAREIECSVMGNGPYLSFPAGEVASNHEFYDYEAKYIDPEGAQILIPAPIPKDTAAKVREVAEKAYEVAGVIGFARVDFFLDRKTGEIALNELNAIPGFTSISMFPMMCTQGGMKSMDLIQRLIDLGLERHAENEAIKYSC